MGIIENKMYYKGYIDGYLAGIKDAERGTVRTIRKEDIQTLPIGIMTVSTRGLNCLSREGCVSVADVAALESRAIESMRSMGAKTASEIAHWLEDHGIRFTAWSKYL